MLRGEPKKSGCVRRVFFDAICFYEIMDDFSGVTLTAVSGRKQQFSPSRLFSLPFPSVSPLISNPVNLRNREVDALPAQVCWHVDWHVRS